MAAQQNVQRSTEDRHLLRRHPVRIDRTSPATLIPARYARSHNHASSARPRYIGFCAAGLDWWLDRVHLLNPSENKRTLAHTAGSASLCHRRSAEHEVDWFTAHAAMRYVGSLCIW
jgi:hypothetical protein